MDKWSFLWISVVVQIVMNLRQIFGFSINKWVVDNSCDGNRSDRMESLLSFQ